MGSAVFSEVRRLSVPSARALELFFLLAPIYFAQPQHLPPSIPRTLVSSVRCATALKGTVWLTPAVLASLPQPGLTSPARFFGVIDPTPSIRTHAQSSSSISDDQHARRLPGTHSSTASISLLLVRAIIVEARW